jgi:hypothetical protein
MKIVYLTIVLLSLPLVAAAQRDVSSPDGDLKVVAMKWRSDVRIPKLERDVVKEEQERQEEELRRREIERLNEKLREQGMPTRDVPIRIPRPDAGPDGIAVSYDYEVKVKNTGNRQIRAFKWEYIFLEPNSDRELGRRQFESEARIGRGKTRTVTVRSSLPPADTVDVSNTGDGLKGKYSEQVRIVSITYADRTVWLAPD